ncbi:MAG TPA: hypothetical protein VK794_01595 [Steroidobacteraceae bacterium]|jgi:hypothetical protein|nr:hypothetical protein [Steroidobacteraceae bacterium]
MIDRKRMSSLWFLGMLGTALGVSAANALADPSDPDDAFIPRTINSSTIPGNGDVNPYGVAFVPDGFAPGGSISSGDVLVSNFNNGNNLQGTGTTIIQLHPDGTPAPPGTATTFFTSSLPGLSTALGVLRAGFVIVGNVPTTDGTIATIGAGALQLIDRHGNWLATWSDPKLLDGPWDLTVDDHGSWARVFVANVLNGTVTRLTLAVNGHNVTVQSRVSIAAGFSHAPNAAALVLGPTGLAYDAQSDTLFVASTADNEIFAIDQAGTRSSQSNRGRLVFAGSQLRGPLALRFAPNGHLLAANGDAVNADVAHPSEIVEFTTRGQFVREYNVDASQGGAFGLDTAAHGLFNYAVIDDVTNSLTVTKVRDRDQF